MRRIPILPDIYGDSPMIRPKISPIRRKIPKCIQMDVSKNSGTPKSSILIGFSIIFTIHFGG